MMTRSGIYWVVLLDDYAGSWGLIFIAILEVVSVSWFYGVDRFLEVILKICSQSTTKSIIGH